MKRITICISLLALVVIVAGCTKQSGKATTPGKTGKPSATSNVDQKATTPTTHTTMKPITPEAGSGHTATPEAKQPEAGKPAGATTATPANTEEPAEKK